MKIAFSSMGKDVGSDVSEVFGRCPFFLIVEVGDDGSRNVRKVTAVGNEGADQRGGAGISAARKVAEMGADAVVTGDVGPRAADVLRQFGIEVFRGRGTIEGVLQKFLDKKLGRITGQQAREEPGENAGQQV